jgi:hypothetical protein
MANESLRTDLVDKLEDLIKQATTEHSHYYVATVAGEAVREIRRLRLAIFDTETPKIIPWAQLVKKAEREGIDIMDYVNGLHVHILNQRDEINRLREICDE